MPLPSLSAVLQNRQQPDIEKTALYPRQQKQEHVEEEVQPKKPAPNFFDMLKSDGANGESKMITTSALTSAFAAPTKPTGNAVDMLAYWQSVAKAHQAERQRLSVRLDGVLKNVRLEGFKQASKARTRRAKIFWLIMIMVIIGMVTFECWKVLHDYYNSPVTTKFTIAPERAMDFPIVYICPGMAINRTYMLQHKDLMQVALAYRSRDAVRKKEKPTPKPRSKRDQDSVMGLDDDEIVDILRFEAEDEHHDDWKRDIPLESDDDGLDELEIDAHGRIRRDVTVAAKNRTAAEILEAQRRANKTKAEEQAHIQALMNSPNISDVIYQFYQEAGFQVDQTFLECYFDGYTETKLDCSKIIRTVIDSNYFKCYVVDLPDEMKQTSAGIGLRLVINTHTNLYPKAAEEKPQYYTGLLVSVDKSYNPFNWEKSMITSGRLTKIDLASTHVVLQDFDSGPLIQHCYTDDQAKEIFQIFNANYSRTTCQMDCLFQSHRNNCDCIMISDRGILKPEIANSTNFCSPSQMANCVTALPDNATVQAQVDACTSECYSPCESYRYDMRVSHANLNPVAYSHIELPTNVTVKQLVDLRVAFSRLEHAELIQEDSASFSDFVSNIGGQLNLWLGASLIALIEMVFAGFSLGVWTCYSKCCKKIYGCGGKKPIQVQQNGH